MVNFHRVLRATSSLTQRFIMYINGIKHNVVTKLNSQTQLLAWTELRTDWQTDGRSYERYFMRLFL